MPAIKKSFREIGQIIAPRGQLAAIRPQFSETVAGARSRVLQLITMLIYLGLLPFTITAS